MRLIGGQWKRTLLPVPDLPGLRPTPDRVRETLFNWLGQDLSGRHCLDLFAGTGALGLEAASRGAARVVCVEQARPALLNLQALVQKLGATGVEILSGEALQTARLLQQRPERFDVIFLDPPFHADWWPRVAPAVWPLLKPEGWVYWEADAALTAAQAADYGFSVVRAARAGQVHYHLLHCNTAERNS